MTPRPDYGVSRGRPRKIAGIASVISVWPIERVPVGIGLSASLKPRQRRVFTLRASIPHASVAAPLGIVRRNLCALRVRSRRVRVSAGLAVTGWRPRERLAAPVAETRDVATCSSSARR